MNEAQGAAGAGESAQTTETNPAAAAADPAAAAAAAPNEQQQQQQTSGQEPVGTLLGDILQGMDLPKEFTEGESVQATAKAEERPNADAAETAAATEEASKAAAGEDQPLPDEWPESARSQIIDARKKLKTRTEEFTKKLETESEGRKTAEQERDELRQQLQSASAPINVTPTEREPLADVFNFQQLSAAKKGYEELEAFAAANPDGAQGVVIGKNADNTDIVRDYTKEEISAMRLKAERILREAIPTRATYLQERNVHDQSARKLYVDSERKQLGLEPIGADLVFDGNGQLTPLAKQCIQQMPQILNYSDALLNIGRFIRGLMLEQKEVAAIQKRHGAAPAATSANPKVQQVLDAKRNAAPLAPTPAASRSAAAPVRNNGNVDVDKKEKEFLETGNEGAIEDMISAALNGGGEGPRAAPM